MFGRKKNDLRTTSNADFVVRITHDESRDWDISWKWEVFDAVMESLVRYGPGDLLDSGWAEAEWAAKSEAKYFIKQEKARKKNQQPASYTYKV